MRNDDSMNESERILQAKRQDILIIDGIKSIPVDQSTYKELSEDDTKTDLNVAQGSIDKCIKVYRNKVSCSFEDQIRADTCDSQRTYDKYGIRLLGAIIPYEKAQRLVDYEAREAE